MIKLLCIMFLIFFSSGVFSKSSQEQHESSVYKNSIQIVVAFTPGGDTDVIARAIANKLSKKINVNVTVINKPGAGGIIGNSIVANSPADGSILLLTPSTFITSAISNPLQIKYNVLTDFTPIIEVTTDTTMLLAVNSKFNITNVDELLNAIKNGKITNYSTPGKGSPMNMVGEYFKNVTNIEIDHIPYQGNAPAIRALLTGEAPFAISSGLSLLPYVKEGKVTVIGSATEKRSTFFPLVRTLHEQGLPEANFSGFFSLVGPKGMNSTIVYDLNKQINEILKDKEIIDLLTSLAHNPGGGSPADLKRKINSAYDQFSLILNRYKIKVN